MNLGSDWYSKAMTALGREIQVEVVRAEEINLGAISLASSFDAAAGLNCDHHYKDDIRDMRLPNCTATYQYGQLRS